MLIYLYTKELNKRKTSHEILDDDIIFVKREFIENVYDMWNSYHYLSIGKRRANAV